MNRIVELKNIQVEILVEEPSMDNFLQVILPLILPQGYQVGINVFVRPHQGKQDLQKSIPKKIQAFSHFWRPVKVLILQDQDNEDCEKLKNNLMGICRRAGNCPRLVRIACRELESWYLGDMDAIEAVYPSFKAEKFQNKKKFRNPETCFPSYELKKIIPNFQKGFASREIPKHMEIKK